MYIPNNQENRQTLLKIMEDHLSEEEFNKEDLLVEMEDDSVFHEFVDSYSQPQDWGIFDEEDYLSDEEISEMDEPPDLLY